MPDHDGKAMVHAEPLNKGRVWAILVEECGADRTEPARLDFERHWPDCREYRFMGSLGFGGKVWAPSTYRRAPYVSCYSEDETPERRSAIQRANARLQEEAFASV